MKILFVSNLFPDTAAPGRGLDNARLLRQLALDHELRVLAIRPKWPGRSCQDLQPLPEDRILRPRYVSVRYVPRVGSRVNPWLYARALAPELDALTRDWQPDIWLGAWLFPDGCALARLAAQRHVPLALIAQGSDVHQYLKIPTRRRAIVSACSSAAVTITRSRDLAQRLIKAGVDAARVQPIYNGVDTDLYTPGNQADAKKSWGYASTTELILFVGNLLPVKDPLLLLHAFSRIAIHRPQARLLLLGEGPLRQKIATEIQRLRLTDHVRLGGAQPPEQVALAMQAADSLVMASHNEGVPNVILEAMACGLPVAAPRVGGLPEVVTEIGGVLAESRTANDLTLAMEQILDNPPDRERLRQQAITRFSWESARTTYSQTLATAAGITNHQRSVTLSN